MESLYHFILINTAGLYEIIYKFPLFFLDYWSFIHFGSGAFLMLCARAMNVKKVGPVIFLILVAYEILELAFIYLSIHVFRPETLSDQLTDLVVGMLGASVMDQLTNTAGRSLVMKPLYWLAKGTRRDGMTAASMACIWVGSYGYHYNVPFLNSPYINWWAMSLWTSGFYAIIFVHKKFRRSQSIPTAIMATWLLTLTVIFIIEFFGYNILEIRETGGYPPLFLNVIHGTPLLKFCYMVAAPAVIVGSAFVNWSFGMLSQKIRRTPFDEFPESILPATDTGAPCKD